MAFRGNRVLLVVDMQTSFDATWSDRLISECKRLISLAKKRKSPIVIMEYDGYGRTIKDILSYVNTYDHTYFIHKSIPNGASQIAFLLKNIGICSYWNNIIFDVCGIQTSCCVLETVEALHRKVFTNCNGKILRPKFNVYAKACNDMWDDLHIEGLSSMARLNRVQIV